MRFFRWLVRLFKRRKPIQPDNLRFSGPANFLDYNTMQLPDGTYLLLAGHRRRAACQELYEMEGHTVVRQPNVDFLKELISLGIDPSGYLSKFDT